MVIIAPANLKFTDDYNFGLFETYEKILMKDITN